MLESHGRKAIKWRYLQLSSRWDRCTVPIYEAVGKGPVPLLKTLITSYCRNECKYCSLRRGASHVKHAWKPEKLAKLTLYLYERGEIKGLFLSSSIAKNPDSVVEAELDVVRNLRSAGYEGYVHLRLMPGVSRYLVKDAVKLANRVGVNLEAPNDSIFREICPDKGDLKTDVLKRLEWISEETASLGPRCGVSIDTQFVIGAIDDTDEEYLKTTAWLYERLRLSRVYYSGFEPVNGTPLERRKPCSPSREYRLYQASFLLRDYGFTVDQLKQILTEDGFLPNEDPKLAYARIKRDVFPVNLNEAGRLHMLKIPGVGPSTADKILEARKSLNLSSLENLKKVVGDKLARKMSPFIELRDRKLTEYGVWA
jgi:predicted DNA-binding helix-hairpin-helix protein